jgi:hypothetical protein
MIRPRRYRFVMAAIVLTATGGCGRDVSVVVVGGEHIRLRGIDAPEREKVCWQHDRSPYSCGKMGGGAPASRDRKRHADLCKSPVAPSGYR